MWLGYGTALLRRRNYVFIYFVRGDSMLRTITALERDGFDVRVLVLNFEVPDEKFDLMAAVKAAALEYCQTDDGKRTFDYNCRYFNWADFEMHVPNEICERHGFSVLASPVADLVVDWDEQLVDETEVCLEDATYVSVWDGGFKVETSCKVNRETGEVFDIEVSDVNADVLDVLEGEFVRFADGTEIAVSDGVLIQTDALLDIEVVREYMDAVRLDDYDLGGCEITEDDFYTIRERVHNSGSKLEDVVHQYLLEIRDVLDAGLDEGVCLDPEEYPVEYPLRNYDDAIGHLCEALNTIDWGMDTDDVRTPIKTEDFIPIFKSENYFGIYCWRADNYYAGENEYYLVDRNNGEHKMVLGDSFEFVGKNLLDCMKDEKVLHVANAEWMRYLVDFSLQIVQGVVPEQELRGIAVLEAALREAVQKEGKYMMGPSLMERLDAAKRNSVAREESGKRQAPREGEIEFL